MYACEQETETCHQNRPIIDNDLEKYENAYCKPGNIGRDLIWHFGIELYLALLNLATNQQRTRNKVINFEIY